ncbi:MAG: hypothetical protein QOJ62_2104 [Actinomycetota bacterium]|nr:hypothetical protein [Actinomycetota bacterium]
MTDLDWRDRAELSPNELQAPREEVPRRPPFPGILVWRPDAVSLLTVVVFTTFVLPSRLVVKGFGAVGTPTNLLGVCCFCLWLFGRFSGSRPKLRLQPVRVAVGAYLLVILVTYAGGLLRGLYSDELNNATRLVIQTVALSGIALVAADTITTRQRLTVLLQRLVYGAAFMGFAGDLEFMTKYNLAAHLRLPGLVVNNTIIGLRLRGGGAGFTRVAGTASHYIEFGVVLGMLLPLALHFAIFSPTRGRRHLNWFLALVMAAGVPFSVSRAAAVALVVGLLVLAACWTWRARVNALVMAALALVALKAAKPGLLGTIRSLFTKAGTDPSITSRTSDYGPSFAFIGQRPIFGRGAGTFLPTRYGFLDNQILMTTIESGFLGLIALLMVLVGSAAIAHRVGKFATDPETKHLGYALMAAAVVAVLTSLTFDSLAFNVFATTTFLVLGVAGALWRLDHPSRHVAAPSNH